MPGVVESLATINSLLRTGLAILGVGLVSAGVYYGYRVYHAGDLALQDKDRQLARSREEMVEKTQLLEQRQRQLEAKDDEIAQLQVTMREQAEQIQKLDTALRLLKVNRRVAWLTVLDQEVDPDTNALYTTGRFVEVDDRGEPLGAPREFRVRGDVVYIDNWVVKFEDEYVERAEIDRSTSLVLFRRIFGEAQTPNDGIVLDPVGMRPHVYGSAGAISEFEKRIWDDFWTIANDEAKARELGIRAAHGEALSMKLQKGKSYKIQLRASDGLSITPDAGPPPVVGKPAA